MFEIVAPQNDFQDTRCEEVCHVGRIDSQEDVIINEGGFIPILIPLPAESNQSPAEAVEEESSMLVETTNMPSEMKTQGKTEEQQNCFPEDEFRNIEPSIADANSIENEVRPFNQMNDSISIIWLIKILIYTIHLPAMRKMRDGDPQKIQEIIKKIFGRCTRTNKKFCNRILTESFLEHVNDALRLISISILDQLEDLTISQIEQIKTSYKWSPVHNYRAVVFMLTRLHSLVGNDIKNSSEHFIQINDLKIYLKNRYNKILDSFEFQTHTSLDVFRHN